MSLFVDCSILALIEEEGLDRLLTFDVTDFVPFCRKYNFSIV